MSSRFPGLFEMLEEISFRPKPFEFYTAAELWTDEHTSARMLEYHLDGEIDVSSRRSDFIERSVEWIISHFGVCLETRIADFGCGPGLYANRLALVGASVTGIDFSPRSIRYAADRARQGGLEIDYINANYLEYEPDEKFDLILMIMCDFCALGPEQRKTMLVKFRSLLRPGGRILLDVYSLSGFAMREEATGYEFNPAGGFWAAGPHHIFISTCKYDWEKVVLDKYTIVEPNRVRTVYNWLQYFSPDSLGAEFSASGLEVAALYGDVAGNHLDRESAEFAIVAQVA